MDTVNLGLSQCGDPFRISKIGGVLSSPLMGQISSAEYTVSGGTDAHLTGRWHLSQGCERDLERPLPLQRGSVSAGTVQNQYRISSIGGGPQFTPNGTNLISGVHCKRRH